MVYRVSWFNDYHQLPLLLLPACQRAVWLYVRFTLSFRDIEELLAGHGIEVSYETIRRRVTKFGPPMTRRLRRSRAEAHPLWHLDEMFVSIARSIRTARCWIFWSKRNETSARP